MELLPIIVLFALMYVVLIRPQQRRAKQQRQLISALEVGDEVVTVGGLVGTIVHLDADTAEVETLPGTVLRFRRVAISGRVPATSATAPDIDLEDGDAT
jgi:preprotein translocase subunit YajC